MALVDFHFYDCGTEVTAYEFDCTENFLKLMVACFGFGTFCALCCQSNNGWPFLYTWTGKGRIKILPGVYEYCRSVIVLTLLFFNWSFADNALAGPFSKPLVCSHESETMKDFEARKQEVPSDPVYPVDISYMPNNVPS